jgi:membrane protease YdiL (CAAX protease family)
LGEFVLFFVLLFGTNSLPIPEESYFVIVAHVLATALSLWLAGHFLDHRPFADFGFHINQNWWRDLAFGLVLGALMMTGVFLVEWALGWVTIVGRFQVEDSKLAFAQSILYQLVFKVGVSLFEEMPFRGYLLRNLSEGFNFPALGSRKAILLAWLVSAIGFGLLHAGNPNATAVSTISIAFAGLLLGLGYILTDSLAIPLGLHTTWNFFQGNVFGFPVSGHADLASTTFIATKQAGPMLLTGGAFGPRSRIARGGSDSPRQSRHSLVGAPVLWSDRSLHPFSRVRATLSQSLSLDLSEKN